MNNLNSNFTHLSSPWFMWTQNISWNLIFLSLPYLHVVELTKIGSQKKKKKDKTGNSQPILTPVSLEVGF